MSDVKRKLGWKNHKLFIILVCIVIAIIALFTLCIILIGRNSEAYTVAAGNTMLDKDYNVINLSSEGVVSRNFGGGYVLDVINSEGNLTRYDLGRNSVAYSDNDYKFYLFGQAYLIGNDNSVKKVENYEEISKSVPAFYKLGDRKYLLADKTIVAKEISLRAKGYLIVELDRQGNATLVNNEINIKTINPIIIKGTYYDFDVANEKLMVNGKEIDLTAVIGTTNEYEEKEELIANDGGDENSNQEAESGETKSKDKTKYYNNYFSQVKDSFNNLYTSTAQINNTLDVVKKKSDVSLDLTRWTKLTSVIPSPNYITINYTVFDPNNEYAQIFVDINGYGDSETTRYVLGKDESSYIIRGLSPDKKYVISYGYNLARIVDESQADIVADNVVVVTPGPDMSIRISKITTKMIYYVLELDRDYKIDEARIQLMCDGTVVGETTYGSAMVNGATYEGGFSYESLCNTMQVRVIDMKYNGVLLNDVITGTYINK